jgi:hypothetical protein
VPTQRACWASFAILLAPIPIGNVKDLRKSGASADLAHDDPTESASPPSSDVTPAHREDFERLLKKSATKLDE